MTVEQLANKANVSIKFIGDVERGQKMPSINTFIKIVNALDVSFDYVLSQDVVPQSLKLYLFTGSWLEQQTHNLEVLGSSPRWPTKNSCKYFTYRSFSFIRSE